MNFCLWAPAATTVDLLVEGRPPQSMSADGDGWHRIGNVDVAHGTRYRFSLDGGAPLPDPRSRWQPDGPFGASAIVDPSVWTWSDIAWPGLDPAAPHVIYEVHIGTFTPAGTFDSAIDQLPRLADLGITAIEIMPVSQFSGERNWGYDGVFPWSVQHSYGGPDGLARLVDAAHDHGIGVLLDVVYNHLGPEGCVLAEYGPYFTDRYGTFWGPSLNFDGPDSDHVRRYFIDSARAFVRDHHIDGFRVDAIHAIVDPTARPFLAQYNDEVGEEAKHSRRQILVIAESAANDERTLRPTADGGLGFDMQWNDDVHHALRVALTGEQQEYYRDYRGVHDLAKALNDRFVYTGQYSPHLRRSHGSAVDHHGASRFVVFSSNHDQVGNRAEGDRLDASVSYAQRKAAAAAILLSPFTPMLFMGEEYGETRPFPYFVSHEGAELLDSVQAGRAAEFADQDWSNVPDPRLASTMQAAVLARDGSQRQAALARLYADLLALRRAEPALTDDRAEQSVTVEHDAVTLSRNDLTIIINLGPNPAPAPGGEPILRTDSPQYRINEGGEQLSDPDVSPWSVAVYRLG